MSKDATYYLHQTPTALAHDLLQTFTFHEDDVLLEPFKGEGAFYNAFPSTNPKLWAEITEGRDYKDISEGYDWVITNPPFRLDTGAKRVNSFWYLLDYYTQRARKGVAFLANDKCFCTLTPKRMELLKSRGWSIKRVVVCSIKKWRGRYFFIVLEKDAGSFVSALPTNY